MSQSAHAGRSSKSATSPDSAQARAELVGAAAERVSAERGPEVRESGAFLGAREAWKLLRALAEFKPAHAPGAAEELSVLWRERALPLVRSGKHPDAVLVLDRAGGWQSRQAFADPARQLLDLYAPLCLPECLWEPRLEGRAEGFVVAHLGQSLDGRIGSLSGEPENITGSEDVAHNHRMRALFDAVLVGAGTVYHDDPLLTVRHAEGRHPVRVVLDPNRTLSADYRIFQDGLAPTLLVTREDRCSGELKHGLAELVGLAECGPRAVLDALRQRGLARVFIEGGGVTVSRFLAAGCLDRLQITVSPLLMGQGRPSLVLDRTLRLRPKTRRFDLAGDVMFECYLNEQ